MSDSKELLAPEPRRAPQEQSQAAGFYAKRRREDVANLDEEWQRDREKLKNYF